MALVIFAILCGWFGQPIHITGLIYFTAGILLILLTAFGAGTFLSALNLKFRDFRYVVPFLMQVLFFSSQVIYPLWSVSSPAARTLLALNPVNAAIELFRAPLGGQPIDGFVILTGSIVAVLLTLLGLYYFRKTESYFADIA
jgi:lipopolysaccharide transport system permease protein